MSILITGGTGYIGSHTCVEILNKFYDAQLIIIDNLSNSKIKVLDNIKKITKNNNIKFYNADLTNIQDLDSIFANENIKNVIHFAALKSVGESSKFPLQYYQNNVTGTLNLLEVMKKYNVYNLVFSSSASVYGNATNLPLSENSQIGDVVSTYARSKYIIEMILKDLYFSDKKFNITVLRYFNPVGAHESGYIGEDPNGIPNNLMPYIVKVALGEYKNVNIYGNDYNTHDGTAIRDYIHVVDLANGHIKALNHIENSGYNVYNLGSGEGFSVLDLLKCFEKACNKNLKYTFCNRRVGDVESIYADITKAQKELGFVVSKNIYDMCLDSWNFAKKNFN